MEQYPTGTQEPQAQDIPDFTAMADAYPPLEPLPVKQRSPRRVGTITMGFSLVAAGALLLLNQFSAINILPLLQWAPVVLILLGLEIILSYAFSRGNKIRYDFLSVVVCFLLIFGSTLCGIIPSIVRYEQNFNNARYELTDQLESKIAAAVGSDNIRALNVNTYTYDSWNLGDSTEITADSLLEKGHISLNVHLGLRGNFADKASFAEAAAETSKKIAAMNISLGNLSITGYQADGGQYSVDLDGWGLSQSAEDLGPQILFEGIGIDEEAAPDEVYGGAMPDEVYGGAEDYEY